MPNVEFQKTKKKKKMQVFNEHYGNTTQVFNMKSLYEEGMLREP